MHAHTRTHKICSHTHKMLTHTHTHTKCSHTHTHTHKMLTHTHTHTHNMLTHTHAHPPTKYAHTHTHTHTKYAHTHTKMLSHRHTHACTHTHTIVSPYGMYLSLYNGMYWEIPIVFSWGSLWQQQQIGIYSPQMKTLAHMSSGETTGEYFQSLEYLVQKCGTFFNLVAQLSMPNS